MLVHEVLSWSSTIKKPKRLWRWNASWKWNYSTRWLKWQKARSWHRKNPWFEWGQTSLNMRLPKLRWFKRYFKLVKNFETVNLSDLEKSDLVKDWELINKDFLKSNWFISKSWLVKILWNWDLNKKLVFEWIDSYSASAKTKIDKSGSQVK